MIYECLYHICFILFSSSFYCIHFMSLRNFLNDYYAPIGSICPFFFFSLAVCSLEVIHYIKLVSYLSIPCR